MDNISVKEQLFTDMVLRKKKSGTFWSEALPGTNTEEYCFSLQGGVIIQQGVTLAILFVALVLKTPKPYWLNMPAYPD